MQKEATPLSRNKLRTFAERFRKTLQVSDEEPFPVVKALETLLNALDYELDIVPDDKLPENYALTIPNLSILRIRESVYENAINNSPRDRFTIAHEIAHLLLHDDITVSFARNECAIPAYRDPEWQANTFAAELLVPFHKIEGLSPKDIQMKYLVSNKVAQIQLSYIQKISA